MNDPRTEATGGGALARRLLTVVVVGAVGAWFTTRPALDKPQLNRRAQAALLRQSAQAQGADNLSLADIRASLDLYQAPVALERRVVSTDDSHTLRELLESLAHAPVGVPEEVLPGDALHIDFLTQLIQTYRGPTAARGVEAAGGAADTAAELAALIVTESRRAQYDPIFVTAVIHAESTFKTGATSHKGARGLMQIMPATGRYLSERENIALADSAALHEPRTNVRLGIAYLKYLEQRFRGNRERALVAYNWGPTNTDQAISIGERFPSQSLHYARKIISTHYKWKSDFLQIARSDLRDNGAKLVG
jgi:soluble lytic murein transglycosylase-like protein